MPPSELILPILAAETLQTQAVVVLATCVVVVLCVLVHYEALSKLTEALKRVHLQPRMRILLLIFAILITHVVEVWLFGVTYFLLVAGEGHGALFAEYPMGLLDCIYFSAVCFTTLGLGDITPVGAIRFLAGTEALAGFVLVTWSASFTFVEMQRFWKS
ncbi:MAG TPA: potassium channel family protein [Cellvibrionaceae bacterium]